MTKTLERGEVSAARAARRELGMELYEAGRFRLEEEETSVVDGLYFTGVVEIVSAIYEVEGSAGETHRVEYLRERGIFACRCDCLYRPPRADVQCEHEVVVEADVQDRNLQLFAETKVPVPGYDPLEV